MFQHTAPTHPRGGVIARMSNGSERYGELIRRKRQEKLLSRDSLARALNTRPQTVMGWEKGSTERFSFDEVRKVGDLLGFSREDYLSLFDLDTPASERRHGWWRDPLLDDEDKTALDVMWNRLRGRNQRKG